MSQCKAITKKGLQCSRKSKKQGLCTQHFKSKSLICVVDEPEPWHALGFGLVPKEENGPSIIQSIRTLLKKGPSKTDRPGYIYVYYLEI